MKEQREEAFFKEVMSKSKLELPFPDFEDTVMMEIKAQELSRETISRNIRMSWVCFIAGTVFGIILSVLLPQLQLSLFGLSPDNMLLIFQLLFSLFVLFGLESLIRYTRKINMNDLFKINLSAFHSMDK